MELNFKFLYNPETNYSPGLEFFNLNFRNQCFSGGYGSTKTYTICFKLLTLLTTFKESRAVIGRLKSVDLRRTTMATFYKICPPELYDEKKGGRRTDSLGFLQLINGSQIYFMHFDDFDEGSARGLEVNWVFIDQAEELGEGVYLHIDSRIGRWDGATVPPELLAKNPEWPRTPETGKLRVPGYMFLACNPENELHWIWKRYHPDSIEHKEKYSSTHKLVTASALDNPTYDHETINQMLSRDKHFVDRYVYGKWGYSEGAIHYISSQSRLHLAPTQKDSNLNRQDLSEVSVNEQFSGERARNYISQDQLWEFLRKAHCYRILDHGDISPTCCLWLAVREEAHLIYREYYLGDRLISEHRENIQKLSGDEFYVRNIADPAINIKNAQTRGGRWCVADEYRDSRICEAKPINWEQADSNEFATRNRVSELLREDPRFQNPFTRRQGAPRLYFLMKTPDYPNGCYNTTIEVAGQKRRLIGSIDGKQIFSEERDPLIPDHAYDCVRYLTSLHAIGHSPTILRPRKGSFFDIRNQFIMNKIMRGERSEPSRSAWT
jgi:hypothetical protein